MKRRTVAALLCAALCSSLMMQGMSFAEEYDLLDDGELTSGEEFENIYFAEDINIVEEAEAVGIAEEGEAAGEYSLFSDEYLSAGTPSVDAAGEAEEEAVILPSEPVVIEQAAISEDGSVVVADSDWKRSEDGSVRLLKSLTIVPMVGSEAEADEVQTTAEYFTSADGLVKITTVSDGIGHTGYYLFDDNGAMLTGKQYVEAGTPGYAGAEDGVLYFTAEKDAVLYSEYASVENAVFDVTTSSVGQQLKGLQTIDDATYYFDAATGEMFMDGWLNLSDDQGTRWVYFVGESAGEDQGKAEEHEGNYLAVIPSVSQNVEFLLDEDGYLLTDAHVEVEDGYYVGSNSSGTLYKNKIVKIGDTRYYFDADGKQSTNKNGYYYLSGLGTYYCFGTTAGAIAEKTGYQRVVTASGQYIGWFYYDNNGDPLRSTFYDDRYFVDMGKSIGGFRDTRGSGVYFFATSDRNTLKGTFYTNTLIHSKGKYYYAQNNGQLLKEGFVTLNGKNYAFKNYVLQMSVTTTINGKAGYCDAAGVFRTDWLVISNSENKVMYVDPNTGILQRNTSTVINGKRYYFDSEGYRINDLTDRFSGPFYLSVDRVNGVATAYADAARTIPVKSLRVSVGLPGTPTPLGTYRLRAYGRWVSLMGPSWGQYGTHVVGAGQGGIFVHSIACSYQNAYNVPARQYNLLGSPASHGCIRMCVADAKWVFENCNGATVTIFDGTYNANEVFKGPLGRRALVPIYSNFDPTDPSVVG